MFSIVIPLYNKGLSVKNTVESVLNQSFQDFEIVIVNDGSTDSSLSMVESIKDSRIRIINQDNQGVSAARNRGIQEAYFEWITFLDADDLWETNHLSVFDSLIRKYPEDKVFCSSHTKSKLSRVEEKNNEVVVVDNYFKEVMQHVDFFWTSAVCVHSSVFKEVGGFPVGINRGEDLHMWARIGKNYRIIRSTVITATYRLDSENKLTSTRSKYNNSILSIVNLRGIKGYERTYYKRMIFRRIKSSIKAFEIKDMLRLIQKYNFELLK